MKHTVSGLLAVFALLLAGIGGWYWIHTSQSEADAEAMVRRKEEAKLVPVKFVIRAPEGTPSDQDLYISGSGPNLGNWEAAGVRLERHSDGSFVRTLELMSGVEYAFKVNRGNWGTVERGPNMVDVENHTFSADPGRAVEVAVASWVDEGRGRPGRITTAGTVIVHPKFDSKLLPAVPRDIVVYLPPGYDSADEKHYPVLYLNDGQNLMNEATSFQLIEWQVDETAQRLIQAGKIQPAIIVGVYNTEFRTADFTPPGMNTADNQKNPVAKGDLYGRFLVEELKPFIDQRYRTSPDRAQTGIGGSAMGGLVAAHVAKAHKDTFGMVALLSPWLRAPDGEKKLLPEYASGDWLKGTKWYVDVGLAGKGAGYPPQTQHPSSADPRAAQAALADIREFIAALDSAGLVKGKDYSYEEVPESEFNETAWQKRVEPMLTFLLHP